MGLKRLEAEHYLAIKYLALPKHGGKMLKDIAAECGVHENTLYNWRKDTLFLKELKAEIVRNTLNRLPEVMESIPDHIIKDGNAALLKTLLQANGMLTDKVEIEQVNGKAPSVEELDAEIERYRQRKEREQA
jgi:Helix-turn-helix of insertion element transposase